MSDTQDIRAWAAATGVELGERGPIPKNVRAQWKAQQGPAEPSGLPADSAETEVPAPETPPVPEPPSKRPPWWRKPSADVSRGTSSSKHRRVSIENMITTAWGAAAMFMKPKALPVAMILDMQAPVAGIIINDAARGTALDAVLQPFARAGEKGQTVMALIGPPMLTAAICANPELYPILRPMLKISLVSWAQISAPAMRKAEKRAQDFKEQFGDVDIDGLIDALFPPEPEAG
jgi:hypothetical protein